jgi:predicted CoA-binding protein
MDETIDAPIQDTEALIARALDSRVWAVVGASRDPRRWGHRVLAELLRGGYTAYPVNPNAETILGVRAYPSIAALPETPQVVEFVTPPEVTERVLAECADRGVGLVWMQPGAGSEAAEAFCHAHGIGVINGACLLHERRYRVQGPGPSVHRGEHEHP